MKWMEMIRVLSSSDESEEAIEAVTSQLAEIGAQSDSTEIFLLQHALYAGDLAAILVWENKGLPMKSREGLMVAAAMQRYGTVDHAVWRAAPGFEKKIAEQVSVTGEGGQP